MNQSINESINESIKNVTIFWNDKERILTTLRTRNTGKRTVYFMSWDARIIQSLPKALAAEFPITLTHRSAIYTPILALQRSLFHKGIGAQQFAQIV
jgi:hypothetical protein